MYRMESRHPAAQMPPLGTVLPDQVALALIRAWIRTTWRRPERGRPAGNAMIG